MQGTDVTTRYNVPDRAPDAGPSCHSCTTTCRRILSAVSLFICGPAFPRPALRLFRRRAAPALRHFGQSHAFFTHAHAQACLCQSGSLLASTGCRHQMQDKCCWAFKRPDPNHPHNRQKPRFVSNEWSSLIQWVEFSKGRTRTSPSWAQWLPKKMVEICSKQIKTVSHVHVRLQRKNMKP